MVMKSLKDEEGSISLLIIGLFVVTLFAIMAMTDIASIAVAQRSLIQATEAASQQGSHVLDLEAYYQGKGTIFTPFLKNRNSAKDMKRIPLDCSRGYSEVLQELRDWNASSTSQKRIELGEIALSGFDCDGYVISINTQVEATLPFAIPFAHLSRVELHAGVATENQRGKGLYLFGHRIL
jgi:hypothetical protein